MPARSAGNLKANAPTWRETGVAAPDLARMLGLNENDIGATPRWVNAGKEQLVVPVTSRAAVDRCGAGNVRLGALKSIDGHSMAYVFHDDGREVYARFFFPGNGAVTRRSGHRIGVRQPRRLVSCTERRAAAFETVSQGSHVGRPSKLYLDVDASGSVQVAGDIIELARGSVDTLNGSLVRSARGRRATEMNITSYEHLPLKRIVYLHGFNSSPRFKESQSAPRLRLAARGMADAFAAPHLHHRPALAMREFEVQYGARAIPMTSLWWAAHWAKLLRHLPHRNTASNPSW